MFVCVVFAVRIVAQSSDDSRLLAQSAHPWLLVMNYSEVRFVRESVQHDPMSTNILSIRFTLRTSMQTTTKRVRMQLEKRAKVTMILARKTQTSILPIVGN